jgi:hypothetical protein
MPFYVIYVLDPEEDEVASPPRIVRRADDHEPVQHARQYLDSKPVEIWIEKKRIHRLEPQK